MPDQRSTNVQAHVDASLQPDRNALAADEISLAEVLGKNLNPELIKNLEAAALSDEPDSFHSTVFGAFEEGISYEIMVDDYIPEIARQLGIRWCEDTLGFAGVTIAVSRLQSVLREIEKGRTDEKNASTQLPIVMLIVPQGVNHTLGAMVIASQLRRQGFTVRLMLGERLEELARQLHRTNFSAVFISASCSETLETLSGIVDVVKTSTDKRPPIVIGGTILDVEPIENVTALTGADYATKKLGEAIKLCGLTKVPLGRLQMMRGQ